MENGQTIEWLGLHLRVPTEWQIVSHGVSVRSGSLVFVDRRHERLKLFWTACDQEPDLERMVSDQRSKEIGCNPSAQFDELTGAPGWLGFTTRSTTGQRLTRAVRHERDTGRLIEAVLFGADGDGQGAIRDQDLLNALRVTGPARGATRLRAFDLDVRTPDGYRLVHARVSPADVTFEFRRLANAATEELGRDGATIRRRGMARAWYSGDLRQLVVHDFPRARLHGFEQRTVEGHQALTALGDAATIRLWRLLGRAPRLRVMAWHCAPTNSVFTVTACHRHRRRVLPEEFVVRCCRENTDDS